MYKCPCNIFLYATKFIINCYNGPAPCSFCRGTCPSKRARLQGHLLCFFFFPERSCFEWCSCVLRVALSSVGSGHGVCEICTTLKLAPLASTVCRRSIRAWTQSGPCRCQMTGRALLRGRREYATKEAELRQLPGKRSSAARALLCHVVKGAAMQRLLRAVSFIYAS